MKRKSVGELALLERISNRAPQGSRELRLGIGDDCALLRPARGEDLAVTTDLSIAGRHFLLGMHPPEAVGHRTLARGLSDLAAMGARPVAAFLSLGLPRKLAVATGRHSWIDRFLDGFFALADRTKTPLAGGDLAESPVAMADIVLVGAVPRGRALMRSGARPGDLLYVTGALGGAAAGLRLLCQMSARKKGASSSISGRNADLLAPHLYPEPRLAQGLWLQRRKLATSAMDLSDGLSTDLARLCSESRVSAEVNSAALPSHPAATLTDALNGGEDYELLFTAAPTARIPKSISGVAITQIGRILPIRKGRPQVMLVTADGKEPLAPRGWEHFS
jgi:thiamine-monophosphate kinase